MQENQVSGLLAFLAFFLLALAKRPSPSLSLGSMRSLTASPPHADTVYADTEGDTGPDSQPGSLVHVLPSLDAKHASPTGIRGRNTDAEEAEASLGQNIAGHGHAKSDNYDGHNVGQDIPPQSSGDIECQLSSQF